MSIEEKAKAYDEALKWMRELYPELHGATKEDAEHYFPELRESEGERIRKWIIEELEITRDAMSGKNPYSDDPDIVARLKRLDEAIDYLEKQQDSLHISETRKENASSFTDEDEKLRKLVIDRIRTATEMTEGLRELLLDYLEKKKEPENTSASTMVPSCWEVEQEEQKPKNILTNNDSLQTAYLKGQTDVIEDPEAYGLQKEQKPTPDWMPKFLDELRSKKNYFDWDEHRDIEGHILAIINWIAPNYFDRKEKEQKSISQEDFDTAKHEALWEEQKPADDTAFEKWLDDWYQDSKEISGYVIMSKKEFKNWSRGIKNMYQQKLDIALIQRSWYMEGYHDRESSREPLWIIKTGEGGPKHELNPKYGQPLVEDYHWVGLIQHLRDYQKTIDRSSNNLAYESVEEYIEWIKSHRYQPKQEWSEDDEDKMGVIIRLVEQNSGWPDRAIKEYVNWLKSIHPVKQEWSEEDENYLGVIVRLVEQVSGWPERAITEYTNWLKSLRPQPKQEVTDEEIEEMVTKRARSSGTTKSEMAFYRNGIKDAIKRFGLRPSWKPSEEHLSALLAVFNDPDNIGSQTCQLALTDLYEQLKKL